MEGPALSLQLRNYPSATPPWSGNLFWFMQESHVFFDEIIRVFCFHALDNTFLKEGHSVCDLPGAEMWALFAVSLEDELTQAKAPMASPGHP